ncbi:GMC oxidoreductase [Verrucomicrobium sp. BvORR106]|uniref:GMC oxidoreductase n=1 Tax=Verrucomicrobium sp. BvORR106 TaxID=1403819 RepID=UPI00056D9FE2|nr:GMC oxidoreductase [Verrucomicrobium sp. BvORR106]
MSQELLQQAQSPTDTPFDYIIVGSGAGGGPLASRLALAGKRVLVLEAGRDPLEHKSSVFPTAGPGEVNQVPGYHGAATEDLEMSWQFSVRHYADDARQKLDDKYNRLNQPVPNGQAAADAPDGKPADTPYPYHDRFLDPTGWDKKGKGGVFYPRSAGLGGCTGHHAMIMAAPNDKDWEYIAELTGDNTWRAENMRGYFARMERNLYRKAYDQWFRKLLGIFYKGYQWIVLQFDPRAVLDDGGHGTKGWQPTSFIDPNLVTGIARKDRNFFNVLIGTALAVLHQDKPLIGMLKQALVKLRIVQHIDPNDYNTRRTSPEGVFLIPTGIESSDAMDYKGRFLLGRRAGVRELLLKTQARFPERLVIDQGVHVTKVLFEQAEGEAPRAVGVELARGDYLYEASPLQTKGNAPGERTRYFAAREVILCGGAFNTPQLLTLSGIGNEQDVNAIKASQKGGKNALPTPALTGIDGQPLKKPGSAENTGFIHLPGVGRNLQDRYEVTIVSEVAEDFSTLNGLSFTPGDDNDPARLQWLKDKSGLYRTNGGAVAVLRRSKVVQEAEEPEPDLFTFGAPAAFRGYYWGWSRELFRPTLGAAKDQRNIWSWVILKGYTRNNDGYVKIRSLNPFDAPEICFDSYNEKARELQNRMKAYQATGLPIPPALLEQQESIDLNLKQSERDLEAIVDAVKFMRDINRRNPREFVHEIQPGLDKEDGSNALREWIQTQSWGHHASCTCRIGADAWQADPSKLVDKEAVLDSHFRVHGVQGLRIVDASVFPRIPGYFILTPIFMMSEKAADTILAEEDRASYPAIVEDREARAILSRRNKAYPDRPPVPVAANALESGNPANDELPAVRHPLIKLPKDAVGLAFSGGGIRSATFCLGVLQALATRNRVRDLDFLSTVSGGGFTGSFLGRLFTRPTVNAPPPGETGPADPCGAVQDVLKNTASPPLWWLRTNANYIFATGGEDLRLNLAVFWRNIFTVHLVVGSLLFGLFGLAALVTKKLGLPNGPFVLVGELSPWWILPALALALGVLPGTLAYWLAPKGGSTRPYSPYGLFAWLVLLTGSVAALTSPESLPYGAGAGAILLLSWLWQEVVRWGATRGLPAKVAPRILGTIVRNRLSLALGEVAIIFAAVTGWALLDTVARLAAEKTVTVLFVGIMAAVGPGLPILRWLGMKALQQVSAAGREGLSLARLSKLVGIPLAIILVFMVDLLAHELVMADAGMWGVGSIVLALIFSFVIGRAFDFLNLSSLHTAYAARLTRTFLGASNEERVYGGTADDATDVKQAHPMDDVPYDLYHPERSGGPLHLINVCLNETVDLASDRDIRSRKGLPMCVTPEGVTVGRRYFAEWTHPDAWPKWQKRRRWLEGLDSDDANAVGKRRKIALRAFPVGSNPNAFHVLASKESDSAEVEPLSLGAWTAVSGAAFSTGSGRSTTFTMSLFLGLLNVRLGYWWDSGILASERPGRFPDTIWRRIKRLPVSLYRMQSMLLSEWRGRFHGASRWFWYLSDGGHFEVTGLYELVRRRLPFMLLVDGGEDPKYQWTDLADLTRTVRTDFGAQVEWLEPNRDAACPLRPAGNGSPGEADQPIVPDPWDVWEDAAIRLPQPTWVEGSPPLPSEMVRAWLDPERLGGIRELQRGSSRHAALARVTYASAPGVVSWLAVIKPGVGGTLTEDIRNYGDRYPDFPQQSTFDQFFDDPQWESYRALGQQVALQVLRS